MAVEADVNSVSKGKRALMKACGSVEMFGRNVGNFGRMHTVALAST